MESRSIALRTQEKSKDAQIWTYIVQKTKAARAFTLAA
jgi:hypothetical protein